MWRNDDDFLNESTPSTPSSSSPTIWNHDQPFQDIVPFSNPLHSNDPFTSPVSRQDLTPFCSTHLLSSPSLQPDPILPSFNNIHQPHDLSSFSSSSLNNTFTLTPESLGTFVDSQYPIQPASIDTLDLSLSDPHTSIANGHENQVVSPFRHTVKNPLHAVSPTSILHVGSDLGILSTSSFGPAYESSTHGSLIPGGSIQPNIAVFGKAPRDRGSVGYLGDKFPLGNATADSLVSFDHQTLSLSTLDASGSSYNNSSKAPRARKLNWSATPLSVSSMSVSTRTSAADHSTTLLNDVNHLPREEQSYKLHFPGLVPTTAYPLEITKASGLESNSSSQDESTSIDPSSMGSDKSKVNDADQCLADSLPLSDTASLLQSKGPLQPIPNPDFEEIPDYYELQLEEASCQGNFVLPEDGSYLCYQPKPQIEYDLDDRDRTWCDEVGIAYDTAESVLDQLDKTWHGLVARLPHGVSAGPEIDNGHCIVCNDDECENTNAIVFCDGCNIPVHQECYGVVNIPEGQWLCRRCETQSPPSTPCVLCGQTGGALKQTTDSRWVHILCALWIDEAHILQQQLMEPVDITAIPPERFALVCSVCRKQTGACVQCSKVSCCTAFHVTCARHNGVFMQNHRILCEKHCPASYKSQVTRKHVGRVASRHITPSHGDLQDPLNPSSAQMNTSTRSILQKNLHSPITRRATSTNPFPRHQHPYEFDPSHPVVNQFMFDRLAKSHTHNVTNEQLIVMCKFWAVKRALRGGAPLLRRLVIDLSLGGNLPGSISDATGSVSGVDPGAHVALLVLRHDLEQLRVLCDQVRKREKLRAQMVNLWAQAWNLACCPLRPLFQAILNKAIAADNKKIFTQPVDTQLVQTYLNVISQPMDLSTVQRKLDLGLYGSLDEFGADLQLIWANCKLFNYPMTVYYQAAVKCETEVAQYFEAVQEAMLDPSSKLIPRVHVLQPEMWPNNPVTKQRTGHSSTASYVPSQRTRLRSSGRAVTESLDYIVPNRPPRSRVVRVRSPSPALPPPFTYPKDESFDFEWLPNKWANPVGQLVWKRTDPGLWWPFRIIGVDREWFNKANTEFPPPLLKSGLPFPYVRRLIKDIHYYRLVIPLFKEGTTSLDAHWVTIQKLRVFNYENDAKRVRLNRQNQPNLPQELVDASIEAYHSVMRVLQPWQPTKDRPIPGLVLGEPFHSTKGNTRRVVPLVSDTPLPLAPESRVTRKRGRVANDTDAETTVLADAVEGLPNGIDESQVRVTRSNKHRRTDDEVPIPVPDPGSGIQSQILGESASSLTPVTQKTDKKETDLLEDQSQPVEQAQTASTGLQTGSARQKRHRRNGNRGLYMNGNQQPPLPNKEDPMQSASITPSGTKQTSMGLSKTRTKVVQQQHVSESESLTDFDITDDDTASCIQSSSLVSEPHPIDTFKATRRNVIRLKVSEPTSIGEDSLAKSPNSRSLMRSKHDPTERLVQPITRTRVQALRQASVPANTSALSNGEERSRSGHRRTRVRITGLGDTMPSVAPIREGDSVADTQIQTRRLPARKPDLVSKPGDLQPARGIQAKQVIPLCDTFSMIEDQATELGLEIVEQRRLGRVTRTSQPIGPGLIRPTRRGGLLSRSTGGGSIPSSNAGLSDLSDLDP